MRAEQLIAALEVQGWARRQIELGMRAHFRCEYCRRYLLRSIEDYDAWQVDHIVPLSKGGADEPANWALACEMCSVMKRDHDITGSTRAERLAAARRIIHEKRRVKHRELAAVQDVVNQYLDSQDA